MGFLLAVIHDRDVDPVDAVVQHMVDDFAEPEEREPVRMRCACTWVRAAVEPNRVFSTTIDDLLRDIDATNAQERWQAAIDAFQIRMRSMVDHPDYGVADPACTHCRGAGEVDEVRPARLESAGPHHRPWFENVTPPVTKPRIWPVGWNLKLAFETKVPGGVFELEPPCEIDRDGLEGECGKPIPAALLLARSLVPSVLAVVGRDGSWHEREENAHAEDIASWHQRVVELLARNRDASVSILAGR